MVEGQIKMQRGRLDGEEDMLIFFGDGVPRCDRALVFNTLCSDRYGFNSTKPDPSFIEELELRGYDLETLKFSIERKQDA